MELLLIVMLTLLNGAFAMAELALTASRKVRLQNMAGAGDKGAQVALDLLDQPTQFLSAVQVGVTSIGVLNGIVGEAAFSHRVALFLQANFSLSHRAGEVAATVLVVTTITFSTILFGELVPKRIGQLYPEPVARVLARPMAWFSIAAKPFVQLLSLSTYAILRLLRINNNDNRAVTEEEISASLEEGVDAGIIEEHEHQMVRNVFELDDRTLPSFMLPRSDIVWMEASATVAECLSQIRQAGPHGMHSWYPVCRGSLDKVVGLVSASRILNMALEQADTAHIAIEKIAEPAAFIPETLNGMELIEQFRQHSTRMVFVVDEYGILQGLLTPHDLLEAITGELKPDAQTQAWAVSLPNGDWELDGVIPVGELKARLDIETDLPHEDKGRYNTLAGLLMAVAGRLLVVGDSIHCAHWQFQIMALEGKRIDKVLAKRHQRIT